MVELDTLTKERDEALLGFLQTKDGPNVQHAYKSYRDLEKQVVNHPDYLSRSMKKVGTKLPNTIGKLSTWFKRLLSNLISYLRG